MATLLMPLPDSDFDPTESGVPWRTMRDHGQRVVFATPSGRTARTDPKMVTGEGLAPVTGLGLSIPLASSSRRLVLLSGVGAWPPPDGCLREDRPANLGTRGRSATAHLAV